jgi:hypothetical protein
VAAMGRIYGMAELMDTAHTYQRRNVIVRFFLRTCLGSPALVALVTRTLHACAAAGGTLHATLVADASCSVLCSLHFFDALASAIGGRQEFFQIVLAARPAFTATGEPGTTLPSAERATG